MFKELGTYGIYYLNSALGSLIATITRWDVWYKRILTAPRKNVQFFLYFIKTFIKKPIINSNEYNSLHLCRTFVRSNVLCLKKKS